MSKFDPQVWKDRAWTRFTRSAADLTPEDEDEKDKLEKALVEDTNAISDLKKVIAWCTSKGIEVNFVKRAAGVYLTADKEIKVSNRLHPQNQLIVLLHECGHALVGDTGEHHDRVGMGYPQSDPEVTKTFHHRVACIDEEMEAWHRGWRLACRLRLKLNRDAFDEFRLSCIKTYIKWALKPGPKDTDDEPEETK